MGSAAWLSSAVEVANAATQDLGLQEDFSHRAFVSDPTGGLGEPARAPAVTRSGLVARLEGRVPTPDGGEFRYRARIAIVGQVAIDSRDEITLSDGMTGPIYAPQGGHVDPATGLPFARTVYLG